MRKYTILFQICLLQLLLICINCKSQNRTQSATTSDKSKPALSKVKKNYFITEYPQEFFSVQCGLEDKAGNMWFGTGGNGIYIYDGKSFTNFTHLDGLCHDDILCACADKAGNIWFGTRNGVIRYKPSAGKPVKTDFTSFLILANTISRSTRTKIPYTYRPAENFVWSIYQDRTGKIWFGTNKGVYVCDPLADPGSDVPLFTRFLEDDRILNKDNLVLKDISGIAEDKDGNIWFSSGYIDQEGICRYDGRSLTNFKPDGIGSFRSIIASKTGDLFFLSTFRGTYRYDGKSFINFTKQIGLKNDTITAIAEDRTGNFWFGAASDNLLNGGSGGVWRYDPAASLTAGSRSLTKFTTKDGLSHNCVFCILEDRHRNIWFGTRNTGLCRYDGRQFTDFTDR